MTDANTLTRMRSRLITAWRQAPKPLRATFALFCAGGIWVVGSVVVLIGWWLILINSYRTQLGTLGQFAGDTSGYMGNALDSFLVQNSGLFVGLSLFLLIIAIALCCVYVALGYAALTGRSTPRVIATVLAGFSLFGLIAGPLTFIWIVIGVVGVVLYWIPTSSAYVAAMTAARLPQGGVLPQNPA